MVSLAGNFPTNQVNGNESSVGDIGFRTNDSYLFGNGTSGYTNDMISNPWQINNPTHNEPLPIRTQQQQPGFTNVQSGLSNPIPSTAPQQSFLQKMRSDPGMLPQPALNSSAKAPTPCKFFPVLVCVLVANCLFTFLI